MSIEREVGWYWLGEQYVFITGIIGSTQTHCAQVYSVKISGKNSNDCLTSVISQQLHYINSILKTLKKIKVTPTCFDHF